MKTSKLQMLFLAVSMAALGVPSIKAGVNGNRNAGILPPHATYKGKTASDWSVAWWQWVEVTGDYAQMVDATGECAHLNNNGADGVFSLAKNWAGVPQRQVLIPSGTPLLVPVMGLGCFALAAGGGVDASPRMPPMALKSSTAPYVHSLRKSYRR